MRVKHSTIHKFIISMLVLIIILTVSTLFYVGYDYYSTSLEGRYFNSKHASLKSSGVIGRFIYIQIPRTIEVLEIS